MTISSSSDLARVGAPAAGEEGRIALNPSLNPGSLARVYARKNRLHIRDILTAQSAAAVLRLLADHERWNLVTRLGGRHVDLDAAGMAHIEPSKRAEFDRAVNAAARDGFQYRYANVAIYEAFHARGEESGPFHTLFETLNAPEVLDFFRALTGFADIGFADLQATRYGPGDFLTVHDDAVEGKNRRAALVLNLTPHWRADWGGLLMFHRADGHVDEAYVPAYNAVNVFSTPAPHSVSIVAPFAGGYRYALTGWLRAGADPGPNSA